MCFQRSGDTPVSHANAGRRWCVLLALLHAGAARTRFLWRRCYSCLPAYLQAPVAAAMGTLPACAVGRQPSGGRLANRGRTSSSSAYSGVVCLMRYVAYSTGTVSMTPPTPWAPLYWIFARRCLLQQVRKHVQLRIPARPCPARRSRGRTQTSMAPLTRLVPTFFAWKMHFTSANLCWRVARDAPTTCEQGANYVAVRPYTPRAGAEAWLSHQIALPKVPPADAHALPQVFCSRNIFDEP